VSPPLEAYAAALAGLPGMGPKRLRALLQRWPADEGWRRVLAGGAGFEGDLTRAWRTAALTTDVAAVWQAHARAGVRVHVVGAEGYPPLLAADHEPPAVLFYRGDPGALHSRRVAIVGTRRCTRYGRDVAEELGRNLAAAGVCVVSGLALGIDGAAHAGALKARGAPPVGVVGSGLDVVYPRRHAELWHAVGNAGLLASEAPMGARPEPWRFPVRNRVMAAVAEVVVVVESHCTGGSRHTVEAAEARDRTVMAVPGSVRSAASAYPNALLADGCAPARDTTDVLVALGLSTATSVPPAADRRPRPAPAEERVLDALGWEPATLEDVVVGAQITPGEASVSLSRLQRDGYVSSSGGWWERVAGPGPGSAQVSGSDGRRRLHVHEGV
jgi:DNA processing protein